MVKEESVAVAVISALGSPRLILVVVMDVMGHWNTREASEMRPGSQNKRTQTMRWAASSPKRTSLFVRVPCTLILRSVAMLRGGSKAFSLDVGRVEGDHLGQSSSSWKQLYLQYGTCQLLTIYTVLWLHISS